MMINDINDKCDVGLYAIIYGSYSKIRLRLRAKKHYNDQGS